MSWWAIDVRAPEADRSALATWLVESTGQAVEEQPDGTLVSFASSASEADLLIQRLCERGAKVEASRRPLEETDWSTRWREGLGPRRLGRLTLVPSWIDYGGSADEAVVVLDPETAFGSGEHGSTRAALRLLERLVQPGARVLDLGSGSGVLAIAAVKLGARRAVGVEQDSAANEIAHRNAQRNRVVDCTAFIDGDAARLAPLLGPADLILSNILRVVNIALLPEIAAALRPNGVAIFSGMEANEVEAFLPELNRAGFEFVAEVIDAGWWAVAGRVGSKG